MRSRKGASARTEVFPILNVEAPQQWRLWQLADSAFPTGGFAHSSGLEAALHQGEIQGIEDFERFLIETLWQVGHGSLPLASAAFAESKDLLELDRLCNAFLNNSVANRASRVQGRTFLATCERSFESPEITKLSLRLKDRDACFHYAPVFGSVIRLLDVSLTDMQRLFLHLALRGMVSAGVRLGIAGPYLAQRIQNRFFPKLDEIHLRCGGLGWEDLGQTAPLLDLFQANHDRLYSRLFQS